MTKERQLLLAQAVQQMRMRGGEEEKDKEGLFKANAVKDVEKGRRRREGGGERALYEDRGHILCVCMCMVGGTFPAQENCHFFTEPGTLVPMRRVRASKRVRARP